MALNDRVVVIGTGAGGLAASAYLAQSGTEVLAFEQAGELGGYMNHFVRRGYQFDPGIHYVGRCGPGDAVYKIFEGLGLDSDKMFCELDPEGFDHIHFPDFEVSMCRGMEAYRDRLAGLFPSQVRGIDRFFKTARAIQVGIETASMVSAGSGGLLGALKLLSQISMFRWFNATYSAFLEWAIDDPKLRAVLAAQSGDYGLPPSRVSALYAIQVLMHYTNGAYFPRGGSGAIRDALVGCAEKHGASFRTNAAVKKIHISDGVISAVELTDGERVETSSVVAAIEPVHTFRTLIGEEHLPQKLRKKVGRMQPSLATFCVYLGMERDLRAHGLGAFNIWDYPSWDIDALYAPALDSRLPDEFGLFLSPNSLKDDSGSLAPRGGSTLEIMTVAPYAAFARWGELPSGKRGDDYEKVKERRCEEVLDAVDKRWPGVVGDIKVKEAATPVTNSYYINAHQGGAYGPAAIPGQVGPGRFSTTTPFPGLYLAGSGVYGGGIEPALQSGVAAAAAIGKAQ